MDPLEANISARIEARRAAGQVITPQEEAEIRRQVRELVGDGGALRRVAELADEETAAEYAKMNATIGLPGAMALYRALVGNCGLSPGRQKKILEATKIPHDLPADACGSLAVEKEGRKYYLVGGEVPDDHCFVQTRAPLYGLLDAQEQERANNQCSFIVYFTRGVYVQLLELNRELLERWVYPRLAGAAAPATQKDAEGEHESEAEKTEEAEDKAEKPEKAEDKAEDKAEKPEKAEVEAEKPEKAEVAAEKAEGAGDKADSKNDLSAPFRALVYDESNLVFYLCPTIGGKPRAWSPRFGIMVKTA